MKFTNNLILGLVASSFTFLNQHLFYFFDQSLESTVPLKSYLILTIIFLSFTFIKNIKIRFFFLGLTIFLNFFQIIHLGYYKTRIQSTQIYLSITQTNEILRSLLEVPNIIFSATLFCIPLLAVLYFINRKMNTKICSIPYISIFFILALTYYPIRSYVSGNRWGARPNNQELDGINVYLNISYFLGKILPEKIFARTTNSKGELLKFKRIEPFDGNIIFILGESLSANRMSLFGHNRKTTPFLESLKSNNLFHYSKGISAGVSTDIAIPFLMNITYGFGGSEIVISGNQCLFKLAKDNKFKTHFFSTQDYHSLRYITNNLCPRYTDSFETLEKISPNINNPDTADDRLLLHRIKELDLENENNFIVLNQRGTHSPYNLRYDKNELVFPISKNFDQQRQDHYDNGVYAFDLFMKDLFNFVQSLSKKTIVIYVSDHGEGLGEDGIWGHNSLYPIMSTVPFLYFANVDSFIKDTKTLPSNMTHFNLSLLISKYIGYLSTDISYTDFPNPYIVFGPDIDGFAGHMKFIKNEDGEITIETNHY